MKTIFNRIWGVLGVLVSASSLFSLAQRGFEIPLAVSLADLLQYYRTLVFPIFEVLYTPIHWLFPSFEIPSWVTDAQVISIAATSVYIKAKSALRVEGEQAHFKTVWSKLQTTLVVGFTLFGLLFVPIILIAMVMLPVYYVSAVRAYTHLKWYQVVRVLQYVCGGAFWEYNIMGVYGYLTLVTVFCFYLLNGILI
ncbi:hypothetical protein [Altibacter sp. HG106]|uniref:hypothetical protein n=1 Tax=Altibacter sp. HG106 TaxID=3023937 RepID=UPI00234FF555|nr:hypothetical protein [Altibacter sp. HG106]MDC7995323.1 hypothetical protein [Altibacter sp. HG106]